MGRTRKSITPAPVEVGHWPRPSWASRSDHADGRTYHVQHGGQFPTHGQNGATVEVLAVVVDSVTTVGGEMSVTRAAPVLQVGNAVLPVPVARKLAETLTVLCDAVEPVAAAEEPADEAA